MNVLWVYRSIFSSENILYSRMRFQHKNNLHKTRPKTDCNDSQKDYKHDYSSSAHPHFQETSPKVSKKNSISASNFQAIVYSPTNNIVLNSTNSVNHNTQQYQLNLRNQYILRRIINPKRDKIITNSIHKVKSRKERKQYELTTNAKESKIGKQNLIERKQNSCKKSRRMWGVNWVYPQLIQKWANCNKQQILLKELQNQRLEKRILNVQSIYFDPHSELHSFKAETNEKMCKKIRNYFENSGRFKSSNSRSEASPFKQLKVVYGFGPTILSVQNVRLNLTPQPKDSDLFIVQLLVNDCTSKYRSCVMPYKILQETEFKFGVNIRKIGEYVPLKFWKVVGVSNAEIGIIDLLLNQRSLTESPCESPLYPINELTLSSWGELQVNSLGKRRIIYKNKVNQCKLRRDRIDQTHNLVSLDYAIYCKKYK